MKKFVVLLVSLLVAQSAQALTEVITTIPAYWVERDGSLTLYGRVNGPCGSAIFGVSKSLANYNEVHAAAILAMTKEYEMELLRRSVYGYNSSIGNVDFRWLLSRNWKVS